MNTSFKTILSLLTLVAIGKMAYSQGMKMGEVITMNTVALKKDANPETFQAYITKEIASSLNKDKPKVSMHLFQADRGDHKGEFLFVCSAKKLADRKNLPAGNPFNKSKQLSDFLTNPSAYTEYRLIGAKKFKSLPMAGILGIHYIKVKQDRTTEFEQFVTEKLHPAVGQLLPDMQLLYYKATAGTDNPHSFQEGTASYITIFTIKSPAARDKYWPAGAPETEILKKTFRPLNKLAAELGSYLVENSYLEPKSGGAAAYFESRQWTDFVHQGFFK